MSQECPAPGPSGTETTQNRWAYLRYPLPTDSDIQFLRRTFGTVAVLSPATPEHVAA